MPIPSAPAIPRPLKLTLTQKIQLPSNQINLSFVIHGGTDKMSLHVTPLEGYALKQWSFTTFEPSRFKKRSTYFVFLTYGFEAPENRTFWISLENLNVSAIFPVSIIYVIFII